ncbi:hypothetical protein N8911_01510 [bacterium]|nr:hypothetical protein [bacterium]
MRRILFVLSISTFTLLFTASCEEQLCDDSCPFANDGVCDDGGKDSLHDVCQLGTDCNDCGERTQ